MNLTQLLKTASLVMSLLLLACGEQEEPKTVAKMIPQEIKEFATQVTLSGVINPDDHHAPGGKVYAFKNTGDLVAEAVLINTTRYKLNIPPHTALPLILRFIPEHQDGNTLVAVVVDPLITVYDINAYTTAIAKKAESLGGYTRQNMVIAAESMVNMPDDNKTSTGFRGDTTKQYGGWH